MVPLYLTELLHVYQPSRSTCSKTNSTKNKLSQINWSNVFNRVSHRKNIRIGNLFNYLRNCWKHIYITIIFYFRLLIHSALEWAISFSSLYELFYYLLLLLQWMKHRIYMQSTFVPHVCIQWFPKCNGKSTPKEQMSYPTRWKCLIFYGNAPQSIKGKVL